MARRFLKSLPKLLILLIAGILTLDLVSRLWVEWLWFQEVDYIETFRLRVLAQFGLWAIAVIFTAGFLLGNLALARQFQSHQDQVESINLKNQQQYSVPTYSSVRSNHRLSGLPLRWFLPLVLGLNAWIGMVVLHHGQVALQHWQPEDVSRGIFFSLSSVSIPLPTRFQPAIIWQILTQLPTHIGQTVLFVGLIIALTVAPWFCTAALAILMSLGFGLILSSHWDQVLPFFYPIPFIGSEPLFQQNISFYVFTLPLWKLLGFWLIGLFLYGLLATTLIYLLSGNRLSQGYFPGFSRTQWRHLEGLTGCLMLGVALSDWLSRYELLYSRQGVVYGASYTDVKILVPAYTSLSYLALAIALFLFGRVIFWTTTHRRLGKQQTINSKTQIFTSPLPYSIGLYLGVTLLAGSALPTVVQRLVVQPNELAREQPYIQRAIAMTRQAFDLAAIDVKTFNPTSNLTTADLKANDLTIRNIRLWDTRPLLETNRQLQQIRPYYRFADADIDRYTLKSETSSASADSATEKQQVLVAARELDYASVPPEAQTWVNQHLVYTHGYGFTISPVNTVGPGGLPDYFIKDIGPFASSDRIQDSIPIGRPRIYYGELTNTYVMTQTKVQELDYPSGSDNVYNTYRGRGGVVVGRFWQRWLLAIYLRDWQMVLTQNFTPATKLLLHRNINQRIRAIAPFLQYDSEPYLVVANPQEELPAGSTQAEDNYLYWIIDAYTTSDYYPYADPGNNRFNYIRASVKVVIDAYHGSVDFYIADSQDPIIHAWNQIFPGMFKPLAQMPVALQSHIRYPLDFFKIQAQQLMTYHMTDPQVFYNREDQWRAPTEIYGDQPQLVEPYHLIMKLPKEATEEFILLFPFTPAQRNNLIAWLAARSDGEHYGKMLLYQFPKQQLVYGTEQIEARINQDPVISERIALWNRQGSKAVQGNLLVIPIAESLLYVEPLYLEAEKSSLPTFVRVIVVFENRIVMAETLEQALRGAFQSPETTAPAIVRPIDGNP